MPIKDASALKCMVVIQIRCLRDMSCQNILQRCRVLNPLVQHQQCLYDVVRAVRAYIALNLSTILLEWEYIVYLGQGIKYIM